TFAGGEKSLHEIADRLPERRVESDAEQLRREGDEVRVEDVRRRRARKLRPGDHLPQLGVEGLSERPFVGRTAPLTELQVRAADPFDEPLRVRRAAVEEVEAFDVGLYEPRSVLALGGGQSGERYPAPQV